MKRFIFIISIISFLPMNGFLATFLGRLTPINVIQGGINNGILGVFYYLLCKGKQIEQENVQKFIENTKPWTDAPSYLEHFKPQKFIAGNSPLKDAWSHSLIPNRPFYIIDSKLYISHKTIFEYQNKKFSDEELYYQVRFEHERQSKLSAIQSESLQPFLEGIAQVIVAKKVGSKILYPTFRPWFRQKGIEFSSWSWSYPKIAISSIADLCTKFIYGGFTLAMNRKNKYLQSRQEVFDHWKEIGIENEVQSKKD